MEMYQGGLIQREHLFLDKTVTFHSTSVAQRFDFIFGFICFCISMDQLRGIENFDDEQKKHTSFLLMFL